MRGAAKAAAARSALVIGLLLTAGDLLGSRRGERLGPAASFARALTADEIVLHELAWAERRLKMYRRGFGGGANWPGAVVDPGDLAGRREPEPAPELEPEPAP
jgi:hypothetical protein